MSQNRCIGRITINFEDLITLGEGEYVSFCEVDNTRGHIAAYIHSNKNIPTKTGIEPYYYGAGEQAQKFSGGAMERTPYGGASEQHTRPIDHEKVAKYVQERAEALPPLGNYNPGGTASQGYTQGPSPATNGDFPG